MGAGTGPLDWQKDAACTRTEMTLRDLDKVFFPDSETAVRAREAAALFCNRCPVKAACLTYAVTNAPYGLFAGTTPEQRRALGRKRDRVKCPTCQVFDPVEVVGVAGGVRVVTQFCRSCGSSWIHSTTAVEVVQSDTDALDRQLTQALEDAS